MPTPTTLTLFILALCGALLLAMAPGQPAALGSPPDPIKWYSDGPFTAAAQIGDVVYIGGHFSQLSTSVDRDDPVARNHLAAFDAHIADPQIPHPRR